MDYVLDANHDRSGFPYRVPDWLEALLWDLDSRIECYVNDRQPDRYDPKTLEAIPWDSPFGRTDAHFSNDVFAVRAYDWDDGAQSWNFKCGEIEIRWYKYLGGGTTINLPLTPSEAVLMYEQCRLSLRSDCEES